MLRKGALAAKRPAALVAIQAMSWRAEMLREGALAAKRPVALVAIKAMSR